MAFKDNNKFSQDPVVSFNNKAEPNQDSMAITRARAAAVFGTQKAEEPNCAEYVRSNTAPVAEGRRSSVEGQKLQNVRNAWSEES